MERAGIIIYLMCFLAGCMWLVAAVIQGDWVSGLLAFAFTFSNIGLIFGV